jgi:hypothetical protein
MKYRMVSTSALQAEANAGRPMKAIRRQIERNRNDIKTHYSERFPIRDLRLQSGACP